MAPAGFRIRGTAKVCHECVRPASSRPSREPMQAR